MVLQDKQTICDEASVDAKLCTQDQIGSFILAANATDASEYKIISKAVHLNDPDAINYPVKKTGFYCVSTYAYSGLDYKAVIEFRNSYGELPAAQIAKLPFYGGLTIVYAAMGLYVALRHINYLLTSAGYGHSYTSKIAMTFVSLRYLNAQLTDNAVPVQNYITAILVFLVLEQLMTWGFYGMFSRGKSKHYLTLQITKIGMD